MIENRKQSTRGAAMLIFVLFFTFATSAIIFAFGQNIFSDLSGFNHLTNTKRSFLISESLTEDVVYRFVDGTFSLDAVESLIIDGVEAHSTTTYDSMDDVYYVDTTSKLGSTVRKSSAELSIGEGSAFNYGLQAGNGGINLANSARVIGNVYSNGTVQGAGSAEVLGDIVSAGPTGLIADISATGSVFANTIDHVETDGDAHYNIQIGTDAQNPVAGIRYTPASNQPTSTFPLSTTTVQEWKDAILDQGTTIAATDPVCLSGTYTLDISTTIGYLKVECNLEIKKTGAGITITLDGPIWVEGNLSFTQGPDIEIDPSLGRQSVQFIVDNPSDRLTSSQIEIRNSTNFSGSGDSRSYIMLMSLNESASLAGAETAIDVAQSANGDVLVYAGQGLIELGNGIELKEVTGYQIDLAQNSDIIYESGLASLLFTSGPGGAYLLSDWQQSE